MRNKFPGYYKPTADEFNILWNEATIVLDANVLLDLFRYSDETVNSLLNIIGTLQARIWIPYQVSFEYHKNLNNVIKTQIESYQETIKKLEDFKKLLDSKRSHPFLTNELHQEIQSFCSKFDNELSKKRDIIEKLIVENPIKEKIATLLTNIGDEFSIDIKTKIFNEGIKRYDEKVPPGYTDKKSKNGNDIYGDLIVWKEILEFCITHNKHIILVTGDVKEDWFMQHMGKNVGPRPELIHEFRNSTKLLFYAYPTHNFLNFANTHLNSQVTKEVIEEVEEIASHDKTSYTNTLGNTNLDTLNNSEVIFTNENSSSLQNNIDDISPSQSSTMEKGFSSSETYNTDNVDSSATQDAINNSNFSSGKTQ